MLTTEIRVLGSARTSRAPDLAEVRLQVSRWGREWNSTHQAVTAATNELIDVIKRLMVKNPLALEEPSIAQISQKSWSDDVGPAFSETVTVSVTFTDFQVMSRWILLSHKTLHVRGIDWMLSPQTKERLTILLSIEAVRDARKQAEILAAATGLRITDLQSLADPRTEIASAPHPTEDMGSSHEDNPSHNSSAPTSEITITPAPVYAEVTVAATFLAVSETEQLPFSTQDQQVDPFATTDSP